MSWTVLAAGFGSFCASGCAGGSKLTGAGIEVRPAGPGATDGATAVVTGDFDDVYAAALVSIDLIEGAVLGRDILREGVEVIRLVTIRDREGTLTAERLGGASDRPGPIRLTAKIGAFGDPEKEERLIRAVGARLDELAGRATAPVGN